MTRRRRRGIGRRNRIPAWENVRIVTDPVAHRSSRLHPHLSCRVQRERLHHHHQRHCGRQCGLWAVRAGRGRAVRQGRAEATYFIWRHRWVKGSKCHHDDATWDVIRDSRSGRSLDVEEQDRHPRPGDWCGGEILRVDSRQESSQAHYVFGTYGRKGYPVSFLKSDIAIELQVSWTFNQRLFPSLRLPNIAIWHFNI